MKEYTSGGIPGSTHFTVKKLPVEKTSPPEDTVLSKFTSCRWTTCYLSFVASLLLYTFRHCLSMAFVCMEVIPLDVSNMTLINFTDILVTLRGYNTTNITELIQLNESIEETLILEERRINPYVPAELEGTLLSSYFYGYLLTPLIGGFLASKFGPKMMIAISLTVASTATMLIPLCIRTNIYLAITMRIIVGISSGAINPSINVLWSHWAPINEKAQLAAVTNSGVNLASIMVTVVSASLCEINIDDGWPFIFYVYGGSGIVWLTLWCMCVFDSPETHPRIKEREKEVIYFKKTTKKTSVKHVDEGHQKRADSPGRKGVKRMRAKTEERARRRLWNLEEFNFSQTFTLRPVKLRTPKHALFKPRKPPHHDKPPWKKIFRSPPFWALVIAHMSQTWIETTITTFIPIYMNDVLEFKIEENGLLSSLPFIGRFLGGILTAYLADKLHAKAVMRTTYTRKMFQTFGSVIPAALLIGVSYLNADQRILAVVLLTLTMTTNSTTLASFRVNHLDIAPRYSGQIMGFTQTCAIIGGIISPTVTAAITIEGSREEWQKVFIITATIVLFANIIFVIFGSGREQDWAKFKDATIDIPRSRSHSFADDIDNKVAKTKSQPSKDTIYKIGDDPYSFVYEVSPKRTSNGHTNMGFSKEDDSCDDDETSVEMTRM